MILHYQHNPVHEERLYFSQNNEEMKQQQIHEISKCKVGNQCKILVLQSKPAQTQTRTYLRINHCKIPNVNLHESWEGLCHFSAKTGQVQRKSGQAGHPTDESTKKWVKEFPMCHNGAHLHKICCCCSVAKSCLILCDPMDCSMPGFPVPHYLPESAQTHVHCLYHSIPLSHPVASPALNFPSCCCC